MIRRENWLDVQEHLRYRREVQQDKAGTLQTRSSALDLLLLWADERSFTKAPDLRPSYPEFLARQRRDGEALQYATQMAWISIAHGFFEWALAAHPRRYKRVTSLWLTSLRPAVPKPHKSAREAYTIEDIRALLAVDDEGMGVQRVKAAIALMFLSGARVGAFVTLPIKAVDLEHRCLYQWPSLGVATKFSKSATTDLMVIPDVFDVASAWDARVRAEFKPEEMWYPNLTGVPQRLEGTTLQSPHRARSIYAGLQELCERAGVMYLSPHSLRHGFARHLIARAETPGDLKAISETMMHSNLGITDGTYGILSQAEVAPRIQRMGNAESSRAATAAGEPSSAEVLRELQELKAMLRER
jgi:site-specific recombinase XerD